MEADAVESDEEVVEEDKWKQARRTHAAWAVTGPFGLAPADEDSASSAGPELRRASPQVSSSGPEYIRVCVCMCVCVCAQAHTDTHIASFILMDVERPSHTCTQVLEPVHPALEPPDTSARAGAVGPRMRESLVDSFFVATKVCVMRMRIQFCVRGFRVQCGARG